MPLYVYWLQHKEDFNADLKKHNIIIHPDTYFKYFKQYMQMKPYDPHEPD